MFVNTVYVVLWITLSGTVILYNKWILAYYGFPCEQPARLLQSNQHI